MPHTAPLALPLPLAVPSATCSLLDPLALITPKRTVRTLTRSQIAFCIAQGHLLVLHRGFVFRLNAFVASGRHPGGALPVLHYLGRDATDEIEAYHPVFALKMMANFVVGRVAAADWQGEEVINGVGWKPLVPPLHLGWSNQGSAYGGVPSIDSTLQAFKEVGGSVEKALGTGPPIGTSLPFLDPASLEPPPPPEGVCPIEQQRLSISFRKFRKELLQVPGLFDCSPWELYKTHIYRCAGLFASFLGFYLYASQKWHYALSAVSLGFFMHQIMFVAHDAGHTEITGDRWTDKVIGCIIASYASGMSLGWWCSQHDVHHMVTNHPEHDPDIQLMPNFAFTTRFFDSLYSSFHACTMHFDAGARFFIQHQRSLFYPTMVVARFSLFGKSVYYLAFKAKDNNWTFRNFEIVGMAVFWAWFSTLLTHMGTGLDGWITRVGYVLIVLLAVCPIHVQIVLSHSAQDSTDMGVYECFIQRQLRTTMDVSCPDYLDFIHGGLHMQIAHHMFPRLPRPNLRKATVLAKQWATANGLEFREKNFSDGNKQLTGLLSDIAGQCRALKATADDLQKGVIDME